MSLLQAATDGPVSTSPAHRARLGTYRRDVDGMRAIAVMLVVGYHLFPNRVPGGFTGVDIFFVISGYLISGIVQRDIKSGSFSFTSFYFRRIRRIFPALIIVLATVFAAGAVLFLPDEFTALCREVAASALFFSNIKLWLEAGYFDIASTSKPLLHIWSLGIEEQFYLLWPLALVLIARLGKWRAPMIAALLAMSFIINIAFVRDYPIATFYSPLSRFWELMAGALLADWHSRHGLATEKLRLPLLLSGLALVATAAELVTAHDAFPGWLAVLPVAGAATLICSGGSKANFILENPVSVYVGRISYPLYLWHWPLLAFVRIETLSTDISISLRLAIFAASLVIAVLTYHLAEMPIRKQSAGLGLAAVLGGAMACAVTLAIAAPPIKVRTFPAQEYAGFDQFRWNAEENANCDSAYPWSDRHGWWFCMKSSITPPKMIVLGNSHANHLYPGLHRAYPSIPILQIGTCEPVDDIVYRDVGSGENPCAGIRKLRQDEFIRHIIDKTPTLKYAVLSTRWPIFFDNDEKVRWEGIATAAVFDNPAAPGVTLREKYYRGLEKRVAYLEHHHLQVFLFLDTPVLLYDVRGCVGRPFLRAWRDCIVPRTKNPSFAELVSRLRQSHPQLRVFDPKDALCDDRFCRLRRGATIYYRDNNHLSEAGTDVVARAFRSTTGRDIH